MKSDPVLEHLVGYKLKRAAVAADYEARTALEPFGVTPARLTALILIRANPGCDQTALGRALSINRSSAMKLVNVLSDRGFVERRPGRDARTNALYVTREGSERLMSMLEAVKRSDEIVAARLTVPEQQMLATLLGKLARSEDDD